MRPPHALAVALVLAVAAALAGPAGRTPPAPAGATDRTQQDIRAVRTLRDATVRVDLPGGHGSGVCRRAADGTVWVWTAGHVAVNAKLILPDGGAVWLPLPVTRFAYAADDRLLSRTRHEAVVVRIDESRDIALLRLVERLPACAGLDFAATPPPLWTPVLCCGSSKGFDGTVTRGVLNFRDRKTPFGPFDQIDAPSVGGNSGGPVVGPDGRVIGLVSGGVGESFTCVVPARVIRQFATEEGLLHAFEGVDAAPADAPARPVEVVHP